MTCEPWSVVVVPFPFSDKPGLKRRPALVLSKKQFNQDGNSILAMITTKAHSPWPGDTEIKDFKRAGLRFPCIVRLKLFTLDNGLILRRIGELDVTDRKKAQLGARLL